MSALINQRLRRDLAKTGTTKGGELVAVLDGAAGARFQNVEAFAAYMRSTNAAAYLRHLTSTGENATLAQLLALAELKPYASHAEALAADKPTHQNVISALIDGKLIAWVRDEGGDCLGGGWRPAGEPHFAHWGGRALRDEPTKATVRHKRTGGQVYEVATIQNPRPNSLGVRVVDGMNVGTGESGRLEPRRYARQKGIPALMNFNAFRNADGSDGWDKATLVPNGFLIAGGVAYSSWASGTNLDRTQGFTVQKSGAMVRRTRGVGDAADYVAEGAVFGTSWGCWLVENGVNVSAAATYMDTGVSGRSIVGQRANGDFVCIAIQGRTGDHGATIAQAAAVCIAEGLNNAYLTEGGGSTQLWWGNTYACPSTDNSWLNERSLPAFLAINCEIEEYDTGLIQLPLLPDYTATNGIGVALRQVGPVVHLEMNVTGAFSDVGAAVTETLNNTIRRFRPRGGNSVVRGFVAGVAGTPGMFFLGDPLTMRTLAGGTPNYLAGAASWTAMHAPENT